MSLDATNVQREKIIFELITPHIPGFSPEPMEVDQGNDTSVENTSDPNKQISKRKPDTQKSSVPKKAVSTNTKDKKAEKNKKQKK